MLGKNTLAFFGILAAIIGILALLSACSSKASPTATAQTSTANYVQAGKTVFANRCSRCHGVQGQGVSGPALIGSNASLGKYNTAQGLFNYISAGMPFDAPGTLSRDEYLQVTGFILTENKFISAEQYNPDLLANVSLR